MDKYKEDNDSFASDEVKMLSREAKNQNMYKDVYLNNTVVDINNILNEQVPKEETVEEKIVVQEETYEEKSYDVNDYIKKAHENHVIDDANRNLENTDFIAREGEIKKLIADIEEKEQSEDIFGDLRGENEDTMVTGKLDTSQFDEDIYKVLIEEDKNIPSTIVLDKALSDETVKELNLEKEDTKLEKTFQNIFENDKKLANKIKKLPLIVFCVTLAILIIVILIIILK